jgi:hypothetical protein
MMKRSVLRPGPRRRAAGALAAACVLLSGCAPEDLPPGDPVTDPAFAFGQSTAPSVHWPYGRPIDEINAGDEPWVATLREWDLLVHASIVIGDISDARLFQLDQWPVRQDYSGKPASEIALVIAWNTPSRARHAPGPTPMVIRSVEHTRSEVHIEVCAPPRWYASESAPSVEGGWRSTGRVLTFTLAEQDGKQVVLERLVDYDTSCSLDSARVGYFDPQPSYQEVPTTTFIGYDGEPLDVDLFAWGATGVIDQDYS